MNSTVFFAWPGNEELCGNICRLNNGIQGEAEWTRFPDGESKFRLLTDVSDKTTAVVCSLNDPDVKLTGLYIFCNLLRTNGARNILLIVPYLPYMRQDKIFKTGEGLSAAYCAKLLSSVADELYTIDPHLHRIKKLEDIYSMQCHTLHAAPLLAEYIKNHIADPVLIGPDSESEQWVADVAAVIGCKYTVLEKIRTGDREVAIKMKQEELIKGRTPVLVDDIISTGRTMKQTVLHLVEKKYRKPVCVAVHAVFAEDAFEQIMSAGAADIVTCNGIKHVSNKIDVTTLFKTSSV